MYKSLHLLNTNSHLKLNQTIRVKNVSFHFRKDKKNKSHFNIFKAGELVKKKLVARKDTNMLSIVRLICFRRQRVVLRLGVSRVTAKASNIDMSNQQIIVKKKIQI